MDGAYEPERLEKRIYALERKLDEVAAHANVLDDTGPSVEHVERLRAAVAGRRTLGGHVERAPSHTPSIGSALEDMASLEDVACTLACRLEDIATRHLGEAPDNESPGVSVPGNEGSMWDLERRRLGVRRQLERIARAVIRLEEL